MCVEIVYFLVCDVIIFEINLIVLIKLFFYTTKGLKQKYNYFENEKNFSVEKRGVIHA